MLHRGSLVARLWPPLVLLLLACALFRDTFHRDTVPAGLDLLQHYSREQVLRAALHARQWPFWNPFEFAGFPLWADPQTGVLYPVSLLLRGLPVPTFLTWSLLLHVWLFGAGGYALARVVGCGRAVATIAGVALMFGGILLPRVYAGHFDVIRSAAWIPLVLALAIRSFDRDRLSPDPLLVAAFTCQILGSWIQHVVYTSAALSLYAAFCIAWPADSGARRRFAPLAQLALLAVLAGGLSAIQLLPSAELVRAAGRTPGVPYEEAVALPVPWRALGTVLTPRYSGPIPFESWETSAYAGVLLPLLAPLALASRQRRRHAVFFVLLGGLALLLASGGPLYRVHHALFPMFRIPGRLMAYWTISLVATGALGLHWLAERPRRRVVASLLLAASAAAVLLDGSLYARRFVAPRRMSGRYLQQFPGPVSAAGRVLSVCESHAHPVELAAIGVPTVDGYNSYFLADSAEFAFAVRGQQAPAFYASYPRISAETTLPDMTLLNLMNVTEVVSCSRLARAGLELVAHNEPFFVYRNTHASGRISPLADDAPGCRNSSASVRGFSAGTFRGDRFDGRARVNVVTPRRMGLLLAEPYYPERHAYVDGVEVPITRIHHALSAICVDAGSHLVEMRFVPRSLEAGAAISLLTAAGWWTGGWRRRRRSRRRESEAPRQPAPR